MLVSQVYPPDPTAVGQHMADVGECLAERGYRVWVFTSDRGYDDPNWRLDRYERRNGVDVLRLPFASFGKGTVSKRMLGGISLVAQSSLLGSVWPGITDLLVTTSPPIGAATGLVVGALRGLPFDFWLMDLNPDEAISLGHADPDSIAVRAFDWLNGGLLRHARSIVALDDAMAERLKSKGLATCPIRVLPPWPPFDGSSFAAHGENRFRRMHGLSGKRVVMYSGNHSLAHPLDTLVDAARRFDGRTSLKFAFIGGGLAKRPIDEWVRRDRPPQVISLPYQPVGDIAELLTAGDVHVVVVGPKTVGIVHPSKLYGALAAGRPVLVIGPRECPAARLISEHAVGWQVAHGSTDELESLLRHVESLPTSTLAKMGERAHALGTGPLAQKTLLNRFCDWLESGELRPGRLERLAAWASLGSNGERTSRDGRSLSRRSVWRP